MVWKRTLAKFRAEMPGKRAYAWVGGVTVASYGRAPDAVDCAIPGVRTGIERTCRDLLARGGFDGIHFDIEMIQRGDPHFIALLEETRSAIRPRPLSVASHWGWSVDYLRRVALHCDQVALMTYDVGYQNRAEYEKYLAYVVPTACEMLDDLPCRLVMGVPTYGEKNAAHDPAVENMASALVGIKAGLLKAPRHRAFQGVAVYAHWTTDEAAWRQMERYWRP